MFDSLAHRVKEEDRYITESELSNLLNEPEMQDMISAMKNAPERPEERIGEIMDGIEALWRMKPTLRFGQLLHIILPSINYMWMLEDDRLLEIINNMLDNDGNDVVAPRSSMDEQGASISQDAGSTPVAGTRSWEAAE